MPFVFCVLHISALLAASQTKMKPPPIAKDEAHGKWRDEWLGEIKKTREMDQNFRDRTTEFILVRGILRLKISKYVSIPIPLIV